MTIKDRGNIKWTSMMLVEHKKKLKKIKEEEKDREKPELSEDKLQRFDYLLQEALQKNFKVKITYYHKKRFYSLTGEVIAGDKMSRSITIRKAGGDKKEILLSNIVDIKLVD